MKVIQITLLALTVLTIGCSTVKSEKYYSLFKVHEKNAREISSIFEGDTHLVNSPILKTYTIDNVHDLKIYCQRNKWQDDSKFMVTSPNSHISFINMEECYQAIRFINMLKDGLLSKIIVTYRVSPKAEILGFDVYK